MRTNFSSFVSLVHAFLPHLLGKAPQTTAMIFTGSAIGMVPAFWLPAYSASKAALDSFVLSLREQLQGTNVGIKFLGPPVVQSACSRLSLLHMSADCRLRARVAELHDAEMGEAAGRTFGMPLDAFTDEAWSRLRAGDDEIIIGTIGGTPRDKLLELFAQRDAAFGRLSLIKRNAE